MKNNQINHLLADEKEQIDRLKKIVKQSIVDEKLLFESLEHPPVELLSQGQKISDKVARFGGSWAFIISFFVILMVWILFNTLAPLSGHFDPYPFILMNLILSCIAALQAPIIMMSQNRQEEKDRKRSENDYMVNLKSELEVRAMNQKIDILQSEQIKLLVESQAQQLEILKEIEQKLEKLGAK